MYFSHILIPDCPHCLFFFIREYKWSSSNKERKEMCENKEEQQLQRSNLYRHTMYKEQTSVVYSAQGSFLFTVFYCATLNNNIPLDMFL